MADRKQALFLLRRTTKRYFLEEGKRTQKGASLITSAV